MPSLSASPGGGTSEASEVMVRVLGPVAVTGAGLEGVVLTPMQRILLARLSLGGLVRPEQIVEAAWPAGPPATARAALQNQVSRLRGTVGRDVIETTDHGYRLWAETDVGRLRILAGRAESLRSRGDHVGAIEAAEEALALVRGEPYEDLADLSVVGPARRAAHTWVRVVEDVAVESAIAVGRLGYAVAAAEGLWEAEPLDEGRAALLVRALSRSGRRGDALAVIQRTRDVLRAELGLDIGGQLRDLQRVLLDPDPGGRRSRLRFVGRARLVEAVVAELRAGVSVVVSGEPGIGVSRFLVAVHEVVSHGRGRSARVVARPRSWEPGAELLELLDVLGLRVDPALGAVNGFVHALRGIDDPVLLVVDDADLLGPSSRAAIVNAAAHGDVQVVLGCHDGAVPEGFVQHVLPGLAEDDVVALVHDRSGRVDPEAGKVLARHSGGHPRVLDVFLSDDRVLAWIASPEGTEAPVPESLAAWALERLSGLTPAARRVAELLAVAGPGVGWNDLAPLLPDVDPDELVRARLVEPGDAVTGLRYGAMRSGMLASIPSGRRAELHHAIAELGLELPVAVTAMHRRESADLHPRAAVEALGAAAAEARRLGAHTDAVAWLRDAVDVALKHRAALDDGFRVELRCRIGLGDALRLAGDPSHGEVLRDVLETAAAHSLDDIYGEAAYALLQLGATTTSGQVDAAVIAVTTWLDERPDDPDRAVIRAAASLAWSMVGDGARSRALFLEAERAAISPETRRGVLPFTYLGLGRPEDVERRAVLADELENLARADRDPVALFEALHLKFSTALMSPDRIARRAALAEMREMIDQVGDVGRRWALLYEEATEAHLGGDDAGAERLAERGLELFGTVSPSRAFAAYASQILALRVTQGRVAELEPVAASLVDDQPEVRAWRAVHALTLVDTDPARAADQAAHVLAGTDEDFTWLAAHVIAGRAAGVSGDAELAGSFRELLEPYSGAGCWQGNCSLGPVDTTLALLARAAGDDAAATEFTRRARRVAHDLGSVAHAADLDRLNLP